MHIDDNYTSQYSMERKLNFVLSIYGMSFLESNHTVFSIIFQLILLSKDHISLQISTFI